MLEINEVRAIGNLTRDPEQIPNQTAVKFGLAINKSWKDKQTGEWKSKACFIDCTAWGKTSEFVSQYLHKGMRVYVEGELDFQQWEDKDSGAKRSKVGLIVHRVQFAESKKDAEQQQGAPNNPPASAPGMTKEQAYAVFHELRRNNLSTEKINAAWVTAKGGMTESAITPPQWLEISRTPASGPAQPPPPPAAQAPPDNTADDLPF